MKRLLIFTQTFPYGLGESYIKSELSHIANEVDEIVLFPLTPELKEEKQPMPSNVKVVLLGRGATGSLLEVARMSLRDIRVSVGHRNGIRYGISYINNLCRIKHALRTWIAENDAADDMFYSYWFDDWASILASLKRQGVLAKYVARAHRFDIYSQYRTGNHHPFRAFQASTVDRVFPISHDGLEALVEDQPALKEKVVFSPLGVDDCGEGPFIPVSDNQPLVLVSCAFMRPVKRIDLLPWVLSEVTRPVIWHHFGGGPCEELVRENAARLGSHITIQLHGNTAHDDIINFYKHNVVHAFLNLSLSEGRPVSIMEALSFGIPIIATDAGGNRELVNEETGRLLPLYGFETILGAFLENFSNSYLNTQAFRGVVRSYFHEHLWSSKVYGRFLSELDELEHAGAVLA